MSPCLPLSSSTIWMSPELKYISIFLMSQSTLSTSVWRKAPSLSTMPPLLRIAPSPPKMVTSSSSPPLTSQYPGINRTPTTAWEHQTEHQSHHSRLRPGAGSTPKIQPRPRKWAVRCPPTALPPTHSVPRVGVQTLQLWLWVQARAASTLIFSRREPTPYHRLQAPSPVLHSRWVASTSIRTSTLPWVSWMRSFKTGARLTTWCCLQSGTTRLVPVRPPRWQFRPTPPTLTCDHGGSQYFRLPSFLGFLYKHLAV